jgi:hypothetical protein
MLHANSSPAAEGRSPVPPRCYTYKSSYTSSLDVTHGPSQLQRQSDETATLDEVSGMTDASSPK